MNHQRISGSSSVSWEAPAQACMLLLAPLAIWAARGLTSDKAETRRCTALAPSHDLWLSADAPLTSRSREGASASGPGALRLVPE